MSKKSRIMEVTGGYQLLIWDTKLKLWVIKSQHKTKKAAQTAQKAVK